ncbi:hypothetical protein P7B00_16455, partial [Clostridium perfringens]|nr:hypothetical protein [Clostridium perfringens]
LLSGAALVYLAPRYPLLKLLLPSFLWSIVTGAVAYAVLQLFPIVPPEFTDDVAMLSVLCAFAGIAVNFLVGREHIPAANISSLLQPVLTLAFLVYS